MAIGVELQDERGGTIARLDDPWGLVNDIVASVEDDASSAYLRCIDPYGDTVFNRLQVPLLIEELERVSAWKANTKLRDDLVRFAQRVVDEGPHLYLKFIGD